MLPGAPSSRRRCLLAAPAGAGGGRRALLGPPRRAASLRFAPAAPLRCAPAGAARRLRGPFRSLLPPTGLAAEPAPLPEREIIPHAEALIQATGADFRIGGAKAFYSPSADFVQVPPQPAFREQINYYRTAFHELSHWTGNAKRLGRDFSGRFGSKPYAREELVAEISAAFICAALGIAPTVRHADYVGSWLEVLKEDNRAIFRAAGQASKAADFVLAFGEADEGRAAA